MNRGENSKAVKSWRKVYLGLRVKVGAPNCFLMNSTWVEECSESKMEWYLNRNEEEE